MRPVNFSMGAHCHTHHQIGGFLGLCGSIPPPPPLPTIIIRATPCLRVPLHRPFSSSAASARVFRRYLCPVVAVAAIATVALPPPPPSPPQSPPLSSSLSAAFHRCLRMLLIVACFRPLGAAVLAARRTGVARSKCTDRRCRIHIRIRICRRLLRGW